MGIVGFNKRFKPIKTLTSRLLCLTRAPQKRVKRLLRGLGCGQHVRSAVLLRAESIAEDARASTLSTYYPGPAHSGAWMTHSRCTATILHLVMLSAQVLSCTPILDIVTFSDENPDSFGNRRYYRFLVQGLARKGNAG